jgi:hypothetical protein
MFSVVENMIIFDDATDYAENWGGYLRELARSMARDYSETLLTERPDGNLFAAMCDGFNDPRKLEATKEAAE